jgi:glutamate--cysteine ligase
MAAERIETRLYVEDELATAREIGLDHARAHYLRSVLRLSRGARLAVFNARDGEWLARIDALGKGWCSLAVETLRRAPEPTPDLWLVFAPIKRARIDFLAEKATELGCSLLQPVITRRTAVGRVNIDRLAANAREAAEQCGRLSVPAVRVPLDLGRLMADWPRERRLLLCAEAGPARPLAEALAEAAAEPDGGARAPWAVMTGPEGGLDQSELDALTQLPFVTAVGLGPRLLRADTAALAALACWQAVLGDGRQRPPGREPQTPGQPITSKDDLVAYLEAGCKPPEDWRIGTEHEKFAYTFDDLRPLPYEGAKSIRAILEGLAERFGWEPVLEGGNPIALSKDGCNVTLEPGGQVELSGAPLSDLHETCSEVHEHLAQVKEIAQPLDIGLMGMGFQPKWRREDIPWMPKGRYKIMRAYMPTRGSLGLDMMLRTCTVQVNLDFESEADMVRKFRVGLALQPVATALFANSPFTEGRPNGFLSYRSHIWTDTDPDRCGILPFVFEDGMGFERYTDHVLDVPMYFVYRDGRYMDASGQSFRDFMAGRLPALPGERPTMSDWVDHLTTLFPEVRMKRYLEMRGADGGPWHSICGLPALWVGLLYDRAALDAAWDLVKDWTHEEHEALRAGVPRQGLRTPFRGGRVLDLARETLEIAESGLKRRARLDRNGKDEIHYLDSLRETAAGGPTPAEGLLAAYDGPWARNIDELFTDIAY